MVFGLIASLGDLTDAELNELALAVAGEISRRAIGTTVAAEAAGEPAAVPSSAVAAYTTPLGRVWHRRRDASTCGVPLEWWNTRNRPRACVVAE